MIIDIHYHLDERIEPVPELLARMESNRIDRVALMASPCEPFHVGPFAVKLSAIVRKMLAGSLNSLGRIPYNGTVTSDGMFSVPGKKYLIYSRPDNDAVASVIKKYPDKFYGWIFINPVTADPLKEIERRLEDRSWIGVKAHPFWHSYPLSLLDETAAFCAEKNFPLIIHLGGGRDNGDFRFLPERHAGLRIIYAHGGVPYFRGVREYCRDKSNVFMDLSSPYLDENLRRRAVDAAGPEKCLFGTDGPYGYHDEDGHYDHGVILSEIMRLPISSGAVDKILGGNFTEITGRG
ncbi:MAG TPA: amidohydrolase family protein [Spirochaetota bacterium]|nr:amidohydrolase family protein [Spirochaetota bacterium]HPJ35535.1 amidohydrolase family protein [Spirochaetota bacterium]